MHLHFKIPPQVPFALLSFAESERLSLNTNQFEESELFDKELLDWLFNN
jgi:hypothetical protein